MLGFQTKSCIIHSIVQDGSQLVQSAVGPIPVCFDANSAMSLMSLCWRHTLPKLTQDGNTNIEIFNFGSDRENIGSFVKTS